MKRATVFLKGGFGNQLFQLCFAKYLERNNFKVKINTDLFYELKNDTPRELTLPLKYFGFDEEGTLSKAQFNLFHKLNSNNLIGSSIFKNLFMEYRFTKELKNIQEIQNKKNFFNSYWKDIKYIEANKDWLISSLKNNEIIKNSWNSNLNHDRAMIHVRRGDFIKDDRHLHASYYEKSIELFLELNKKLKFDVFTDDEDWVKSQKVFSYVENIFSQKGGQNKNLNTPDIDGKDDSEETIKTFSEMLKYKHFISGNSSFAFWAAFIRSDSSSIVSVPKPWFRDNDHPTLAKSNWHIIENI